MNAPRKCAVPFCGLVITPGVALCGAHWRRVSRPSQLALLRAAQVCKGSPMEAPESERSDYFNALNRAVEEVTARV